MIREPAVAGTFYPAAAATLAAGVDRFLGAESRAASRAGLLVPHAGYVYSGAVAGATYARVGHPGPGRSSSGPTTRAWGAPGRRCRRPRPGGRRSAWSRATSPLCEALAGAPGVAPDAAAHAREHSLEVQLPFLQRVNPELSLAALCLAHLSYAECEALAAAVAAAAREAGALRGGLLAT